MEFLLSGQGVLSAKFSASHCAFSLLVVSHFGCCTHGENIADFVVEANDITTL